MTNIKHSIERFRLRLDNPDFDNNLSRILNWANNIIAPRVDRQFKQSRRISGSVITTAATGWQNVDNTLDLTLPANVGDLIEVSIIGHFNNEATPSFLDVFCIDSTGLPQGGGGNGGIFVTTNSTGLSPGAWSEPNGSQFASISGSAFRIMMVNDLDGKGNVHLRMRVANLSAVAKQIQATLSSPLIFSARNLGPA